MQSNWHIYPMRGMVDCSMVGDRSSWNGCPAIVSGEVKSGPVREMDPIVKWAEGRSGEDKDEDTEWLRRGLSKLVWLAC